MTTPDRDALIEWLEAHNIDPELVDEIAGAVRNSDGIWIMPSGQTFLQRCPLPGVSGDTTSGGYLLPYPPTPLQQLVTWLRAQLDQDEERFRNETGDPRLDGHQEWRLADIAAKRAILDQAELSLTKHRPMRPEVFTMDTVARLLGTAYADRDGYRPEWSPE
jgi:hypothetical protein